MRIAVLGHVEHVALGRVPAVPRAGEIAHLQEQRTFPAAEAASPSSSSPAQPRG